CSMQSRLTAPFLLAAIFVSLAVTGLLPGFSSPAWSAPPTDKPLEFRGQVVIPPHAVMRNRRITLVLLRVATPLREQPIADSSGRFQFHKVPSGTYNLAIRVPGFGEMPSTTVEITSSFADSKGRVEKSYSYDEAALAHQALPATRGLVSVRQLS